MPEEKISISTGVNISDIKGVCDTCTTSCCNEAFGLLRDKFDMMTVNINNQTENIPALNSFNFIASNNTKVVLTSQTHFKDISGPPRGQCPNVFNAPREGGDIISVPYYTIWGFREEYSFKIFCGDDIEVEVVETLPDATSPYDLKDVHIVLPDAIEGLDNQPQESRFALHPNMTQIIIKGVDATPQNVPEEFVKTGEYVNFSPDHDAARRSLHPQNQAQSPNWSYPQSKIFTNKNTGHKVVMIKKVVPVSLGVVHKQIRWKFHENTCPRAYLSEEETRFGAVDWCREEDILRQRRLEQNPNSNVPGPNEMQARARCLAKTGDNSHFSIEGVDWVAHSSAGLNTQILEMQVKMYSNIEHLTYSSFTDAVQGVIDDQIKRGYLDKIMSPIYHPEGDDFTLYNENWRSGRDQHAASFATPDEGNLLANLNFSDYLRPECFSGMTYSPTGLPSFADRCTIRRNDRLTKDPSATKARPIEEAFTIWDPSTQDWLPRVWMPSSYNKFLNWFFIEIYDPMTGAAQEVAFGQPKTIHNETVDGWLNWVNITVYEVENTDEAATSLEFPLSLREITSVNNKHAYIYHTPTNGASSGGAIPQTAKDASHRFAYFETNFSRGYNFDGGLYGNPGFTWMATERGHTKLVNGPSILQYGPDYFADNGAHVPTPVTFSSMHHLGNYTMRRPGVLFGSINSIKSSATSSDPATFMWEQALGLLPSYNDAYLFGGLYPIGRSGHFSRVDSGHLAQDPSIDIDLAVSDWAVCSTEVKHILVPPSIEKYPYMDRWGRSQYAEDNNIFCDGTNQVGTYTSLYTGNYRAEGGSGWPSADLKTSDASWEVAMYQQTDMLGDPTTTWRASGYPDNLPNGDGYLWFDSSYSSPLESSRFFFARNRTSSCQYEAVPRPKRFDCELIRFTAAPEQISTNYTSSIGIELR